MRTLLLLWLVPLVFFWGWYGLSVNDLNFGTYFFSRQIHDTVFAVYSNATGIPARELPGLIAGACAFDTAIIAAIAAFRWRASWYPQLKIAAKSYWNGDSSDASVRAAGEEVYRYGPAHLAE